jgi:hypothetical protein
MAIAMKHDITGDRRARRRYPLELPLRYHSAKRDRSSIAGVGLTHDLSTGGLAFAADHELTTGSAIEIWVAWPIAAEGMNAIELRILGRVVRAAGCEAAIQIKRHDFVISAELREPDLA